MEGRGERWVNGASWRRKQGRPRQEYEGADSGPLLSKCDLAFLSGPTVCVPPEFVC